MSYGSCDKESTGTVNHVSEDHDSHVKDNGGTHGGEGVDYDDALCATGYGMFHYILATVMGLSNASDSLEIACIAILMPAAECDLHMTSEDKGWLSSVGLIGMLFGSFIWGCLGDIYGRRPIVIITLLINGLAGVASSFVQSYGLLLAFRLICGFGVGGTIPVACAYLSEFQPSHRRGGAMSFAGSFWMVGKILGAAFALVTIPYDTGFVNASFSYNSWRIFLTVCALPALITAILMIWLPESPMFLLLKGQQEKALATLKRMYTLNTNNSPLTYPVKSVNNTVLKTQVNINENCWETFSSVFTSTWQQTKGLFSHSLARLTIIMNVISIALMFGVYGLMMWFPELFNRLILYYNDHPDAKIRVCELQEYYGNKTEVSHCDTGESPVDIKTLYNILIFAATHLPARLWTIFCMDKLGARFFLVFTMVTSGVAAFVFYFVNKSVANLIVACVFGAVSSVSFTAVNTLATELFPTYLRSTALAVISLTGRLGAIVGVISFGYLVDIYCAIPISLVASVLIGGGFCGLILPNTVRVALQ